MKQKQSSPSATAKSDGQKPTENSSAYFIAANCLAGIRQKCDQLEQHLKHSEDELVALNPSLIYSNLQLKFSKKLREESLAALNATISAAKSLRSLLSEESVEAPSSASATSQTTDSEEPSTANGGQMNHNAA